MNILVHGDHDDEVEESLYNMLKVCVANKDEEV